MWVLVPAQGGKGEVGTMAGETHTLAKREGGVGHLGPY